MKFTNLLFLILIPFVAVTSGSGADLAYIHHDIKARIEPVTHFLSVEDEITLPTECISSPDGKLHFLLDANLQIATEKSGMKLKLEKGQPDAAQFGLKTAEFHLPEDVPLRHYTLAIADPTKPAVIKLKYSGEVYHPIKQQSEEYARSFSETPGIISAEGVVLYGAAHWLPWFRDHLVTFNLQVDLPDEWDAVSQGARRIHLKENGRRIVRWESPEPMDDIYLIGGKFTEYAQMAGAVNAMVFLRQPDDDLAQKYLEATQQYLEMYRQLIGPFPYSKFALVENFWETGYGMPSFTLLGPTVIRLPFILHSSYPHELLHNYWGNGVFIDYSQGNWCEGLTAYMADHLIKEQRGQGADYRRTTLQSYTDYVHSHQDFPLTEFRERHNAATQAVGYGKALMLFHILRYQYGDEVFKKAIQRFYRMHKFTKATFADVQEAFESASGEKLDDFFRQWLTRKGAPVLRLSDAQITANGSRYTASFKLEQIQTDAPYRLYVPVALHLAGEKTIMIKNVELTGTEQAYKIACDSRPVRIEIDPQFDVFRKLDRNEIPPALSQLFGAEDVTIVLPADAPADRLEAYQNLANTWAKSGSLEIRMDSELSALPADRALWLFGRENKFIDAVHSGLKGYDADFDQGASPARLQIGKNRIPFENHSLLLTVRNPQNPANTIAWMTIDVPAAVPGLGRKLPHYGKYSYLGFEGDEPANILKGQWNVINSPLCINFEETASEEAGTYPPRSALIDPAPIFTEKALLEHVAVLADDKMKGRGFGTPELDRAAQYIADEFKNAGLQPGSDNGTFFQLWQAKGGDPQIETTLQNVIGIIPGSREAWSTKSLVVCAHYDHLGLGWPDVHSGDAGKIHNGADDNASGVSIMIELAKILAESNPERTIVFIAFTAEECGLQGSSNYVQNMKRFPAKDAIACLNLDTVGRLGTNKLMILGANSAREWIHIFMGTGYVTGVNYELIHEELDASDQVSFIKSGVPGVQFFSGPHFDYHRPTDDIDKIDAAGMVKIATFVREVVLYLANREEPLTSTMTDDSASASKKIMPRSHPGRRVSFGIMPDFEYQGQGVKVGAVSEGSGAEAAGLHRGDIILKLNDRAVDNLKAFSKALGEFQPGENVRATFQRGDKSQTVSVKLGTR
ncbi:M20/M25/M40 family metallo-hydrolase [candidate division KSB1 bacterium]|nr:M20/M25/M40 family metallo-hydrolase [candidate division KSB1 bacterium]